MAARYMTEWKNKIAATLKAKWPSLAVRLFSKAIEGENGCWEWVGAAARGYGIIQVDGMPKKAHRVAWECTHGEIPAGFFICHHCDNPRCIRPDHLFSGTCLDNERDKYAKGRENRSRRYTPETRSKLSNKMREQQREWKSQGVHQNVGRRFVKGNMVGVATRFQRRVTA